MDLRDEFIERVVRGYTFAEVGGLWGLLNEKVSVAHRAGATKLSMIDASLPQSHWWPEFRERIEEFGVGPCECISADVCKFGFQEHPPIYDVVHCSGVLYHHPNPLLMIEALRRITGRYLILTSAVTQEVISNELGTYTIPRSGVLFVPALSDRERQILAKYWAEEAGVSTCYGISETTSWDTTAFGPWWFVPTATALGAMATCCRFRVLDSGHIWNNNAFTLLLETA